MENTTATTPDADCDNCGPVEADRGDRHPRCPDCGARVDDGGYDPSIDADEGGFFD